MNDHRVGRRYAQALFDTAVKFDVVKSVEDDLDAIDAFLKNDPDFRAFLTAPYTSRDEKVAILERLFSDRVTALTMQVLRVLLEGRRESEIPNVRDEYVALRRAHEGAMFVRVTSAEALDEAQEMALVAKLGVILDKKIEAKFDVDAHLLGGVRVEYEGSVIDGTARGALSRLRERLKYDLLKRVG